MSGSATNGRLKKDPNIGRRKLELGTAKRDNQSEGRTMDTRTRNRSIKLEQEFLLEFEAREEGETGEIHEQEREGWHTLSLTMEVADRRATTTKARLAVEGYQQSPAAVEQGEDGDGPPEGTRSRRGCIIFGVA